MKDADPVYRAVDWEPMEVSLVSVPEDYTVGVGRAGNEENEVVVLEKEIQKTESERSHAEMTKPEVKEPEKAPAKVDVDALKAEIRSAELSRTREILAIGEQHKQQEMARSYINDGKSLEEFRSAVLSELAKGAKPIKTQEKTPEIGMSEKEIKQYSFMRAIRTQIDNRFKAEFEREASDAAAKKMGKEPQGLYVPYDVLRAEYEGQRDLTKGTGSAGGFLVSTDLLASSFIGLLRNRMMVRALGAQTLGGLVGDILIPRLGGGATAYWVDENGAPTESQQAFEQVAMQPRTVGAFTEMSRKLLLQSSLDVENLTRSDLATVLALAIDLAAINGSGLSNQPKGILKTTGIGSVAIGTDGGPPLWAHMVDLESQIANKNADVNTLAYLTNSKVRGKLKQTEKAANTAQFIWENGNEVGFGMVNGYRSGVSNQVPSDLTKGTGTNLSAILFGNWSDLLIGEWGALDILVNPYANDKTGAVRVRVLQDVDIAVRHPESFAALVDATT
jgi:HK97 family phage major capsid protein